MSAFRHTTRRSFGVENDSSIANRQIPSLPRQKLYGNVHNDQSSPRRSAPEFTRKRDSMGLADARTELLTALVPLTQLIEASQSPKSPTAAAKSSIPAPVNPKPKRKRIRIKTERRREQCRNNQARYRNRQRGILQDLDDSVQGLRAEIQRLDAQRHTLCYGLQTKQNPWSVVVEYFRLFRYGFLLSPRTEAVASSEFPDQQYFLKAVMAENVAIGELVGVDALVEQWRRYSSSFEGLNLELDRMETQPLGAMLATCTLRVTVTEATLQRVFPHLLDDTESQEKLYDSVRSRMISQRICCRSSIRFLWDDSSARMTRLDGKLDLVRPLLRLFGSLDDVNAVLSKARITSSCLLGTA